MELLDLLNMFKNANKCDSVLLKIPNNPSMRDVNLTKAASVCAVKQAKLKRH